MSFGGGIDHWMQVAGTGKEPDNAVPMFHTRAVPDEAATQREGRPIYRDTPYVEIHFPGQPRKVVVRPVKDEHKSRWPQQWEAYQRGQERAQEGTPLEQWAYLTPSQVAGLKHAHIYTVEQLAAVSDGNLGNLGMGARDLRTRAQQHIKGPSETERELRSQLSAQTQELADLKSKLEQALNQPAADDESEAPRPRGRPRKAAA